MENEIEAIKGVLDVLIARTLAQEALLLHLARNGAEPFWLRMQSEKTIQALRLQWAQSTLTDSQIELALQEFERLHHLLATTPPEDELPY